MFLGALFKLSQSHPSCVACPEDLEPLAASGYPGLVLSTRLPFFDLGRQGFLLSSLRFMGLKACPFMSFGL